MLMLSYPSRWRYDILRALDYFRLAEVEYDSRMDDAIDVLLKKRRVDNKWPVQARHPGQTHFDMEKTGKPSHWNTLRALRVLKYFEDDHYGGIHHVHAANRVIAQKPANLPLKRTRFARC
jgi:hypothetical protein